MPLHDWNPVPSGLYHDFHQRWTVYLADFLNRGKLPKGFEAYVEQHSGPVASDVLTLDARPWRQRGGSPGGVAVAPPVPFVRRTKPHIDAGKANRIVVKHRLGKTVAAIEIVSPGNKDSRVAFANFVKKSREFLDVGIHLLIVDPFPPTPRDPAGVAKAVWEGYGDEDFPFPPGKDRTLVSFRVGLEEEVFYEPVGVGDELVDMPLFLTDDFHIPVPLRAAYDAAFEVSGESLRQVVLTGEMPLVDGDDG